VSLCIFVFYDSEVSQSTFIFYGEGGINIHLYFIERGILLYFCILVSLEHSNVHLYSIDNGLLLSFGSIGTTFRYHVHVPCSVLALFEQSYCESWTRS
jgi:hypothetical protein